MILCGAVICGRKRQDQRRTRIVMPNFHSIHMVPVAWRASLKQKVNACACGAAFALCDPCLAVKPALWVRGKVQAVDDILCCHDICIAYDHHHAKGGDVAQKIIIVGGGIIGAAAAYHLARAGAAVTIIDAGHAQATSASFGWVNASYFADAAHYRLRVAGMNAYADLAQALDVPVENRGSIVWEDKGSAFDAQLAKLHDLGADVQVIDAAQIANLEPALANPPARAMLFASEIAVDSALLTRRLIQAAQAAGVQMITGQGVISVTQTAGRVTGVKTLAGAIAADQVLIAAGTQTGQIADDCGVPLPMLTRPGLMLRTQPMSKRVISHILASPDQELRQTSDGAFLAPVGAGHQAQTADDVTTAPDMLAAQTVSHLNDMIKDVDLKWSQITQANRPMPQDGLPAVGAAGPAGLYLAVMHSGITLGAVMGNLIAGEMLSGVSNTSGALLGNYRPTRFGATGPAAPDHI